MAECGVFGEIRNKSSAVQRNGTPIKVSCQGLFSKAQFQSESDPSSNLAPSYTGNIQVLIRTRASSSIDGKSCISLDCRNSIVSVHFPHTSARKVGCVSSETFRFEGGVLSENITQDQLFAEVGDNFTNTVLEGFNVTLFAYGQTGSGKTHTMYGPGSGPCILKQDDEHRGFVARILECLCKLYFHDSRQGKMALSFIEIYEERVFDLLESGLEKRVREGGNGVFVDGAVWKPLHSVAQSFSVCEEALRGRRIFETKMNARSSRSHTICMIKVSHDREQVLDGVCSVRTTSAVLTMVDLCGSERVKKSDAEGSRLREAININSSLSALKSVITALGDGATHIPYRESKLTWLLKDCIGVNVRSRAVKNERIQTMEERLAEQEEELMERCRSERRAHVSPQPPPADLSPQPASVEASTAERGTQTGPPGNAPADPTAAGDAHPHVQPARCSRAVVLRICGPDSREATFMARCSAPLAAVVRAYASTVGLAAAGPAGAEHVTLWHGGACLPLSELVGRVAGPAGHPLELQAAW